VDLGEAVLTLKVDSSQLDPALDKSKEKTNQFADTFKKLLIAFASIETAKKVIQFLGDCVNEFILAEASATRLAGAVKSTGDKLGVTTDRLMNLASSLQRTTRYSDEASQGALTLLMTIGRLTSKMAAETLPVVQDLAAGLGIDLEQAAMLVSKAMEGNTGALGRYGIKLTEGVTGSRALAEITEKVEGRFKDLAITLGDTAGAKLVQLKNAFSDVKEEIGRMILEAAKPFLTWLTQVTTQIATFIKAGNDLREALNNIAKGIGDTSDFLKKARDEYSKTRSTIEFINQELLANIYLTDKMREAYQAQLKVLRERLIAQKMTVSSLELLAQSEAHAADAASQATKDTAAAAGKAGKAIQDLSYLTGWELQHMADTWVETVEGEIIPGITLWEDEMWFVEEGIKSMVATSDDELSKLWLSYHKNFGLIQNIVTNAMRTIFTTMGEQIATSSLTWETFGESVIHVIGAIVSALGDELAGDAAKNLVKALATSALPFPLNLAAPGFFRASAIDAAGAATAWLAGGLLSAVQLHSGADFVVPPGYEHDSFPMRVESGEHVTVTPRGGESGDQVIHNYVSIDGTVLADWFTRASRNKKILTTARSVVP
jgi:hypothetical protein